MVACDDIAKLPLKNMNVVRHSLEYNNQLKMTTVLISRSCLYKPKCQIQSSRTKRIEFDFGKKKKYFLKAK